MATHEQTESYRVTKPGSDRSLGVIFAVVFLVISLAPIIFGGELRWWALAIAVAFAAVAIAYPALLAPLNRLWMRFALLLHHVTNPIVMGLVYFGAVVPMGLILRARGKDLLRLKRQPEASTYWIPREPPGPQRGSMAKQF